MPRFWRRFRHRVSTWVEFRAWLRIGGLVLLLPLLLRLWPLQRLLRWLSAPRPVSVAPERLVYYVDSWMNRLGGGVEGHCLRRSLALFYALRAARWPVQFHLGVARDSLNTPTQLRGHAWLSCAGAPCFEREAARLGDQLCTYTFPPDSASSQARKACEVSTHC